MKKLTIFLTKALILSVMTVFVSSCSSDEPAITLLAKAETCVDKGSLVRSVDDAYEIALRAVSMFDDVDNARSRNQLRLLDLRNPIKVIRNPLSRIAGSMNDTLMYIVNYADSMGFAVVSAVKGTPELIAVTMSGTYDPAEPGENIGFNIYMDNAYNVLKEGVWALDTTLLDPNAHIKPTILERSRIDTVWINKVPNRVKVNWTQDDVEGSLCPNKIAGCVPLAVAMMMSGFGYPESLSVTYTSSPKSLSLDWSRIREHRSFGMSRENCGIYTHYIIPHLCRELGSRMASQYNSTSTSTNPWNLIQALPGIGFPKITFGEVGPLKMSESIKNNTILLVRGVNSETGSGHRWVCDAVKHYKLCYSHYLSHDSGKTWKLEYKDYSKEVAYYFYNWGWGGDYNGYFLDMNYKPGGATGDYSLKFSYLVVEH